MLYFQMEFTWSNLFDFRSNDLRLVNIKYSKAEIDELVEKTLSNLGLLDCADVMIGGALIKGISGGQRKRTSVVISAFMFFITLNYR